MNAAEQTAPSGRALGERKLAAFKRARRIHLFSWLVAFGAGTVVGLYVSPTVGLIAAFAIVVGRGTFNWRQTRPYAEAAGPLAHERIAVTFPVWRDALLLVFLAYVVFDVGHSVSHSYAYFVIPLLIAITADIFIERGMMRLNARDAARNVEISS